MAGWFSTLFKHHDESGSEGVPVEEGDRLLQYLFDIVEQQNHVAELVEKYQAARKLPIEKRDHSYITLYTALEYFITKNRPPVVSRSLTKESLRLEIRQHFQLNALPLDFQLIFFAEREQTAVLCSIASRELIHFLTANMTAAALQTLFDKIVHGTVLEGASIDANGLRVDTLPADIRQVSVDRIISAFKLLNTSLFREISGFMGEASALALVERVYGTVKLRYDPELVARFLESLPLGVLENERATFLSREDLEKKIQDRTKELVKVQRDLQTERDRANTIISSMGEGLINLDAQQRISLVNKAAESLLGMTAGQLVGKPWESVLRWSKGKSGEAQNTQLLRGSAEKGTSIFGLDDDLYLRVGERQFPVAASLSTTAEGAVMVFRDITQEKEANDLIERTVKERTEEVQEGQSRLVSSINSLELGFIMTDSELNIIIANKAAEDILTLHHGKPAKLTFEAVDKLLGETFDLATQSRECLKQRKPLDFDNLPFGKQFLRIYISPIIHHDKAIGCAILIEDVTEARVLARSKEEFFTIASHELRTPLIAIRGFASTIKELYPAKLTPEQVLTMVDRIDTSGSRLLTIVNTFLDVSRLEQGKMPIGSEPFTLEELITTCVDELGTMAKDKKLKLEFTASKTPTTLNTDKNLVKQVLYNLVGNGIKFTEKGTVSIAVSHTAEKVKVTVTDTGNGIPPEAQALLFRKFQQTGDMITRDNSQGTGLGLYISKLIMEQLGGQIKLDHSTAKGSSFSFVLPLKSV